MLSALSMCVLTTALAQAPADGAWLKAVPADVDVVVRFQGLAESRDRFEAMLKAMSPSLAAQAVPAATAQLDQFKQSFGEGAVKSSWVSLVRIGAGEGGTPFAVMVLDDNAAGVLASINHGKAPELKPADGGVESFDAPDGKGTWYTAKGPGFVAFGPDRGLIAGVAKPGSKTLGGVLTPAEVKSVLAGDVGLYVNAAALATRYADQIEAGRQALMAALDQAGAQVGNASIESAKTIYGALFDSLKYADRLTLSLDVSAAGLGLGGALAVKADSDAARSIAASKPGNAALLGKLPPSAGFYAYMQMNGGSFNRLQRLSLSMMGPAGKPTPEQEKVAARLAALGPIETVGATSMDAGMKTLNEIIVSDPKAYISANLDLLRAMKGVDGPAGVFKDVKVEENAATLGGLTFTRVTATIDTEKLEKLSGGNPASTQSLKAMFGGDTMTNWFGTDGKRLIQVTAANWEEGKASVEAYLKGAGGIGERPGFRSVRSLLPEKAGFLMLISAQGLTKMIATQLATALSKPELKPVVDAAGEPALFGLSLTPVAPASYEFHLVVPSAVVPVIEKGLAPVIQSLQAGR